MTRRLQWLCVPFALHHEAVGSLEETRDKWLGSLDASYAANYIDVYLLLIFGGIPWQVRTEYCAHVHVGTLAVPWRSPTGLLPTRSVCEVCCSRADAVVRGGVRLKSSVHNYFIHECTLSVS